MNQKSAVKKRLKKSELHSTFLSGRKGVGAAEDKKAYIPCHKAGMFWEAEQQCYGYADCGRGKE